MDTLARIADIWEIDLSRKSPIEIVNVGRDNLAQLFCALGYRVGAEIGVLRGDYSEVMFKHNPGLRLHLIDPYAQYSENGRAVNMTEVMLETRARLANYDAHFTREYSMDVIDDFADGGLDFVYIDGNHSWPNITQDIYWWARKVRPGGIVAGHDYYKSTRPTSQFHVIEAVNGYTSAYKISPWFLLGTKAKNPGEVRDKCRSWFWVKEENGNSK
jgi:predicted O-methyltransferase YrrM